MVSAGIEWGVIITNVVIRVVGGRVQCARVFRWPVGLFGGAGEVFSTETPDSATPLVLSRQTQATLGTVLRIDSDTVDVKTIEARGQKIDPARAKAIAPSTLPCSRQTATLD